MSLQFPKALASEIKAHCKIPVALPKSFTLDTEMSEPGYVLALDYSASENQYSMNIFERPKGSHTDRWAMATLVGLIESTTDLSGFSIPGWFTNKGYYSHRRVTLDGHVSAVEYNNSKIINEEKILWGNSKWRYVTDGMGAYEPETAKMANTIADFVTKHGSVVPNATHGYVQALWSGNRPDFTVLWTYNDKQWYVISMSTLLGTLSTSHTVQVEP